MPGYLTKHEQIVVAGVDDLFIRPLFGLLWPSGAELAACLARRPVRAGERILELGCGLALASLVGHRRGADVTASDCHPLAPGFLAENLRLNALAPMKYRHGHWGGLVAAPARGGVPAAA